MDEQDPDAMVVEQTKQKPRMTVVETVYHRLPGESPTSKDIGFSFDLESDEQIWERRMKVCSSWIPLDCGWVESVGMVIVKNESDSVIEIGVSLGGDQVPVQRLMPKESLRMRPHDSRTVLIRSVTGAAAIVITVYPN